MKPLYLEFQAFLSYKDKVEIDFSKLDGSLFLISGNTGSGKTTIFDAMCYALYGQCTSEDRNKQLKSDFADLSELSYVKFTFEQNGKIYTITRQPAQDLLSKKKSKGEYKVTQKAEEVVFEIPDENPITGTIATKKAIIDVIKFNVDQFRKTMMIAQGKFTELIRTKSDKRSELLRDILQTKSFDTFTEKLKSLEKESDKRVERNKNEINTILKQYKSDNEELNKKLNCDNPADNIFEELSKLMGDDLANCKIKYDECQSNYDDQNKLLNNLKTKCSKIEEDNRHYNDYHNVLTEYDELIKHEEEFKTISSIIETYNEVKEINKAYQTYNDFVTELNAKKVELSESEDKLKETAIELNKALTNKEKCEDIQKHIDENKVNINNYDSLIECFDEKENLEKEKISLNTKLSEFKNKLDIIDVDINKYKSDKEEKEKYIEANSAADVDLANARNNKANLESEKNEINKIKRSYQTYKIEQSKVERLKEERRNLAAQWDKATNDKIEAEKQYRRDTAGYLADDLKEGAPCPVCGSIHHPSLATACGKHITKEYLDKLTEIEKSESLSYNNKNDEVIKSESNISSLSNTILDALSISDTSLIEKTLEDKDANIDKQISAVINSINNINTIVNTLKQYKNDIKAIDSYIEEYNNQKDKIKNTINNYNADLKSNSDQLHKFKESLADYTLNDITDKKKACENENLSLSALIKNYNKAYDEINSKEIKLEVNINNIKENITSLEDKKAKQFDCYNSLLSSSKLTYLGSKDIQAIKDFYNSYTQHDINQKTGTLENYKTDLTKVKTLLEQYKKDDYDKLELADTIQLEESIKKQEEVVMSLNAESMVINSKYQNNKDTLTRYLELYKKNETELKAYGLIKKLSSVADGQVTGKTRISFETYYQQKVFKQILDAATKRLSIMSNGQYQMMIHKTALENTKNEALDIDIFDINTGKIRPANNLSGGETFMAALSLAMGLSEISRNKNGAKEIDCMFIDEGFGSLSKENIDEVIRVLKDLSNESNRMIGIISHVDALDEQISKKIIVTKGDDGSKLVMKI